MQDFKWKKGWERDWLRKEDEIKHRLPACRVTTYLKGKQLILITGFEGETRQRLVLSAKRRNKNTACILVVKNTLIACSITAVELARWGFCVSCDDGSLFFLKVSTYFKKFSQNPMKQQCSIWYLDLVFGLISVWAMMVFCLTKKFFRAKLKLWDLALPLRFNGQCRWLTLSTESWKQHLIMPPEISP